MDSFADWLKQMEDQAIYAASKTREVIDIGPFRGLIDRATDLIWLNYAVPTGSVDDDQLTQAALAALRAAFTARDRTLRFEFTSELWPTLPQKLVVAGLKWQAAQPTMLCLPDDLRPPAAAAPPGAALAIEDLTAQSSRLDWLCHQRVLMTSFGGALHEATLDSPPTVAENERHVIARLDGEPVGIGALIGNGPVAELAGVGTLPEFRRRGVAATVSAWLTAGHFARGGQAVWLSAGDAIAEAVYAKIGFRSVATRLNYIDAAWVDPS